MSVDCLLYFMNINFSEFKDLHFVNVQPKTLNLVKEICQKNELKVIQSRPSIKEYHNVVYSPLKLPTNRKSIFRMEGFLYQDNQIIESSRVRRSDEWWGHPTIDYSESELRYDNRSMLYLGRVFDHYGHFLLESLSRLWCFNEFDNLKNEFDYYLIHIREQDFLNRSYATQLLDFLGIEREKIIWFDKLTKIKSVTIPEASISLKNFVYTAFHQTFTPIHNKFDQVKPTSQPLYLSRTLFKNKYGRNFINEDKLENLLIEKGFNVVHPQFLSLEKQMYLFNRHKYIIGLRGSALHNILFSLHPKTLIHLCSFEQELIQENPPVSLDYLMLDQCCQNKSFHLNVLKTLNSYKLLCKMTTLQTRQPLKILKKRPIINENTYMFKIQIPLLCDELKKMGLIE